MLESLIPTAFAATSSATEESMNLFALYTGKIVLGLITLIATFILASILKASVQKVIRKKQGDQHEEVRILYGRVTFTTTLCIGILVGLTIMGAPLEWFSGGIGIGVAFSLRSFLANFFAGLNLLSNNKFNLGDFVIIDAETKGTIVDIQSRATSLRAPDGGEITVPNMKMLDSNVKCYTKNPIRRHSVEIGVGYGSNLKEASDLILKIVKANEKVQPEPEAIVVIKEVAASAVILETRFWTESKTPWWIIKSEITRAVFDGLQAEGIDIPYPVTTLHMDETSSELLAENPNMLGNLKKLEKAKKSEFRKLPSEEEKVLKSNEIKLTAAEIEKQAAAKKNPQKLTTADIEKQTLQGDKSNVEKFEATAKPQPGVAQENLTAAEIEKRSQSANSATPTPNANDSDIVIKPAK